MRPGQISTFDTLALQSAKGSPFTPGVGGVSALRATPAIRTPQAEIEKTLQYVTITVGANQIYPQVVNGDYLYVDKITADGFEVFESEYLFLRPDSQNATSALRYSKASYKWDRAFSVLQFTNTSAIVYVIKCWIGFGEIRADRDATTAAVGGDARKTAAQIIRPANVIPYAANQIVNIAGAGANWISFSATAGTGWCKNANGVVEGTIRHMQVFKSTSTTTNASFRLYLFDTLQAASATFADQQPFDLAFASYSTGLLGMIDFPSFVAGSGAGAVCDVAGLDISVIGTTDNIQGLLVASAAYVPGSAETFRILGWADSN